MMESHSPSRRVPRSIVGGCIALGIVAGSGIAVWNWTARQDTSSVNNPDTPQEITQPANPDSQAQVPVERTVQLYWLQVKADNRFEVVPRPVTLTTQPQTTAILEAAIAQLLEGTDGEATVTTIPDQTQLRQVVVKADGIHVDLSEEFTTGGGSASMTGRVAQILYTATTLDEDAKVWLLIEGKPLKVLGGEGLILDGPLTRQDFEKNFQL